MPSGAAGNYIRFTPESSRGRQRRIESAKCQERPSKAASTALKFQYCRQTSNGGRLAGFRNPECQSQSHEVEYQFDATLI